MPEGLRLDLPDGRVIDFRIRSSSRAKSVWLRVVPHDGLVVTVPPGISRGEVLEMVADKADWVTRQLQAYALAQEQPAAEPVTELSLRAVEELWRLRYVPTQAQRVSARAEGSSMLRLSGAVEDLDACETALRRWLLRYARSVFEPWLGELAKETGLSYTALSVKSQRSRWGSCTRQGRISLNAKLLFLPSRQVRYVMLHELCHTLEHNHSPRYWDLVRRLEPDIEGVHREMRAAWKLIPAWVDRRR